jgi:methyltransferase family protein
MCDDLVPIGDPRRCREYSIEILFCDRCVTAHQRFQIPKTELFPPTYHYRSRYTADVLDGMRQLVVASEVEHGPLAGKVVLDIGCNDGSLLAFFRQKGALTFGIEPTDAAQEPSQRGHDVIEEFLSEAVAAEFVKRHGRPDIVTFSNVFAAAPLATCSGALRCLS